MFCTMCGNRIEGMINFCSFCGNRIYYAQNEPQNQYRAPIRKGNTQTVIIILIVAAIIFASGVIAILANSGSSAERTGNIYGTWEAKYMYDANGNINYNPAGVRTVINADGTWRNLDNPTSGTFKLYDNLMEQYNEVGRLDIIMEYEIIGDELHLTAIESVDARDVGTTWVLQRAGR